MQSKKAAVSLYSMLVLTAIASVIAPDAHAERKSIFQQIFKRPARDAIDTDSDRGQVRRAEPVTRISQPTFNPATTSVVNFGGGTETIQANPLELAKYPQGVFVAPNYKTAYQSVQRDNIAGNIYGWKIRKATWDAQDEVQFGAWLRQIGRLVQTGKCQSFNECLNHPENPLRVPGTTFDFYTDCADLAYQARAFFAWRYGLPFSLQTSVRMRVDPTVGMVRVLKTKEKGPDGLYQIVYNSVTDPVTKITTETTEPLHAIAQASPNGNYVSGRTDIIMTSPTVSADIRKIVGYPGDEGIMGSVASSFLRTDPRGGAAEVPANAQLIDDTYPVRLTRQTISPGVIMYDSNGHVALVTEVDADGNIFTLNAHPGDATHKNGSMSYKMFSENHMGPDRTYTGWGWKRFRPLALVGAQEMRDTDGSIILVGGKIQIATNEQIPDFSLEQYYGLPANPAPGAPLLFKVGGQSLKFHPYLKYVMAGGSFSVNPISETAALSNSICTALQDRIKKVDAARVAGVVSDAHAATLPDNIYSTGGAWENYATASGDFRIRNDAVTLTSNVATYLDWFAKGGDLRKQLQYNGATIEQFKSDLADAIRKVASACSVTYTNSLGSPVTISFETAVRRAVIFSMDHEHCPELRWGAYYDQNEMASCATRSADSIDWFRYEQRLRNLRNKDSVVLFGQTLEDLKAKKGPGSDEVSSTDVFKLLK